MSLTRINSRDNLTGLSPKSDTQNNVNTDITTSSESSSKVTLQDKETTPKKNPPKINIKISIDQNFSILDERNISPRKELDSPTGGKEKEKEKEKLILGKDDQQESNEKGSTSIAAVKLSDTNYLTSTVPILQTFVTKITINKKLLNDQKEDSAKAAPSSPRISFTPSSATTTNSTTANNTRQEAETQLNTPSIQECTTALLDLIIKKYEKNIPTSGKAGEFGRLDIYFPVVAMPKTLTHLTEFPDNGIASISELLIKLFGEKLRNSQAWKKVEHSLKNGLSIDDLTVPYGEEDPEVKRKYLAFLNPNALNIADYILGQDKTIKTSALPTEFLNLLFEGDKKLLSFLLNSAKLSSKEMNGVRLNFLHDMVVTRFAQVLVMEKLSKRTSQVESWFGSAIIKALGKGIKSLSPDFLNQANKNLPTDLIKKFTKIIEVEKLEIKNKRMNELKNNKNSSVNNIGHKRSSSEISNFEKAINSAMERKFKKNLAEIKSECGFDKMDKEFLDFLNKKFSFSPKVKIDKANIIIDLNEAIRTYERLKTDHSQSFKENIINIRKNLDKQSQKEFIAKINRSAIASGKDIKLPSNLSQNLGGKDEKNTSTASSNNLSPVMSSTASTTSVSSSTTSTTANSTTANSTSVNTTQSDETSSEKNSEEQS